MSNVENTTNLRECIYFFNMGINDSCHEEDNINGLSEDFDLVVRDIKEHFEDGIDSGVVFSVEVYNTFKPEVTLKDLSNLLKSLVDELAIKLNTIITVPEDIIINVKTNLDNYAVNYKDFPMPESIEGEYKGLRLSVGFSNYKPDDETDIVFEVTTKLSTDSSDEDLEEITIVEDEQMFTSKQVINESVTNE